MTWVLIVSFVLFGQPTDFHINDFTSQITCEQAGVLFKEGLEERGIIAEFDCKKGDSV